MLSFSLLLCIHDRVFIAYADLNVGLSRSEITGWYTVRDCCVISIFVVITDVTRYAIRQE